MRKIVKFLTSRLFISFLLISIQIAFFILVGFYAQSYGLWIQLLSALSVVMSLFVITRDLNPAYKIGWMFLFIVIPIYGGLFYILFGTHKLNRRLRLRLDQLNASYIEGMEDGLFSNLRPIRALES